MQDLLKELHIEIYDKLKRFVGKPNTAATRMELERVINHTLVDNDLRDIQYDIIFGDECFKINPKRTIDKIVLNSILNTPLNILERFINESELDFNDISSEKERVYTFPNKSTLVIEQPLWLHVSESGGHRLIDSNNTCYYIKPNESWYITWKVHENEPHFVK